METTKLRVIAMRFQLGQSHQNNVTVMTFISTLQIIFGETHYMQRHNKSVSRSRVENGFRLFDEPLDRDAPSNRSLTSKAY